LPTQKQKGRGGLAELEGKDFLIVLEKERTSGTAAKKGKNESTAISGKEKLGTSCMSYSGAGGDDASKKDVTKQGREQGEGTKMESIAKKGRAAQKDFVFDAEGKKGMR